MRAKTMTRAERLWVELLEIQTEEEIRRLGGVRAKYPRPPIPDQRLRKEIAVRRPARGNQDIILIRIGGTSPWYKFCFK